MPVAKLDKPGQVADLKDWGAIPTMLEGESLISGLLLHRNEDGSSECGIWVCTPGTWACHVERDEFCHFLDGWCSYHGEDGQVIEIAPDSIAFFPAGWQGTCVVSKTVRKIYMIR